MARSSQENVTVHNDKTICLTLLLTIYSLIRFTNMSQPTKTYCPGDSIRDLFISPVGGRSIRLLEKVTYTLTIPKKVTFLNHPGSTKIPPRFSKLQINLRKPRLRGNILDQPMDDPRPSFHRPPGRCAFAVCWDRWKVIPEMLDQRSASLAWDVGRVHRC